MKRYYIGKTDEGKIEVFEWDDREEPTPILTGYKSVEGPYNTFDEAAQAANNLN